MTASIPPEENETLRRQIRAYARQNEISFRAIADAAGAKTSTVAGFVAGSRGASPKLAEKLRRFLADEAPPSANGASAPGPMTRELRLRLRERLAEFGGAPRLAKAIGVTTRELKSFLDAGPATADAVARMTAFTSARPNAALVKANGAVHDEAAPVTADDLLRKWGLDAIRLVLGRAQRRPE